jgi:hypothetical protein
MKGGDHMGKSSSSSSRPSSGKGSASFGRGASPSQLSQKSGTTMGGWTKSTKSGGGFTMKKSS